MRRKLSNCISSNECLCSGRRYLRWVRLLQETACFDAMSSGVTPPAYYILYANYGAIKIKKWCQMSVSAGTDEQISLLDSLHPSCLNREIYLESHKFHSLVPITNGHVIIIIVVSQGPVE